MNIGNRRQIGHVANPITLESIESYERQFFVALSAWEKKVLCRIDDHIVPILNGSKTTKPKTQPRQITDADTMAQEARARKIADEAIKEMKSRKGRKPNGR